MASILAEMTIDTCQNIKMKQTNKQKSKWKTNFSRKKQKDETENRLK